MYTQGQIRVESRLSIERVDKLHWEMKRGEHGRLMLQGSIARQKAGKEILGRLEDSVIKLYAGEELLFCGLLEEVSIAHEGESFTVELQALSSTIKLDEEKRSRSFQDTEMTYQEALGKVIGDTEGAILSFQAENRKLGAPAYQLEETDWEWIKRMCGHLQEVPLAWSYGEMPGVQIGLKGSGRYRDIGAEVTEERSWKRDGILYRQIRAGQNWEIGDRLLWKDREYFILEKKGSLEKGLLWFSYTTAKKEALEVKACHNLPFTPRRLPATVLERKGELVRVKFDMDMQQDRDRAYWYPWNPVSGNLLYCMPEVGERIYIELENVKGSRARAVEGIRQNGEGNPELFPARRLFTTKDKKRMEMSKERLAFQDMALTEPLQLLLEDVTGIEARSNRGLNIWAKIGRASCRERV